MTVSRPSTGALPSLFVGSSTEGLEVARTIRSLLADDANITLWNEGFFSQLGSTFVETLVNNVPSFDFALLVLTPDDLVQNAERATDTFGPRDNLIFELGLFTAAIGRGRTFIVRESLVKMPSDLSGVTAAVFDPPHDAQTLESALGRACDLVPRNITAQCRDHEHWPRVH